MRYEDIIVNQEVELVIEITEKDVLDFSALSGDTNSVHLSGYKIVHGMLIMSYISMIIGTWLPGDGAIWESSNIRFIQPVFAGDTVAITATVMQKKDTSKSVKVQVDVCTKNGMCVATNNWVNIH